MRQLILNVALGRQYREVVCGWRQSVLRSSWLSTLAWTGRGLVVLLGLVLVLSGCAPTLKQLKTFKQFQADKDFQAIAAQEVDCKSGEEGCNQLHLIKGDACFRLAKQGLEAREHYECAVKELESGIEQAKQWELAKLKLNRAQFYENLCESLRNLQDLQQEETARATGERLFSAAEKFHRLHPENVAAIYFVSKARFRKLQPGLLDVTDENRQSLCRKVIPILDEIERAMPRARATRYEQNYRLFRSELMAVKRNILKCP